METSKITLVPGLSGLNNLGNTCYLNSVLQPLAHTKPFLQYLLNNKYNDNLKDNIIKKLIGKTEIKEIKKEKYEEEYNKTMTVSMYKLFDCMWREICTVSPKTIKTNIATLNDMFAGNSQHDSQEILCYILDSIHEETKCSVKIIPKWTEEMKQFIETCEEYKKTSNNNIAEYIKEHRREHVYYSGMLYYERYIKNSYSIITKLFTGLFYTKTECLECGNISNAFDPFVTISLGINSSNNLEECLKSYSEEEHLKGDDLYKCSCCNKMVEAKKRIYIWESPEILIIHLKRFLVRNGSITHKLDKSINIPLEGLELKDNYVENNNISIKYNLYAVTAHTGNCNGGHYVSYIKNGIDNYWYRMNDEMVYRETESIENKINTSAYILYYNKVN